MSTSHAKPALDHNLPSPRLLLVMGTAGLCAAGAAAAMSSALAPKTALAAAVVTAAVGICLIRIDVAVMVLVATAPLETEFSDLAGTSVTKLVGGLLLASFAVDTVRHGRRLHFDRSHAVVLGLLAIALLSMLQARDQGAAMTTTLRYASFAAVYVILAEVGDRRDLVRRTVWALAIASFVSAVIAIQNYLDERTVVATLRDSNPTDFAFILVTTLPLTFWLLNTRPWLRPIVIGMIATMCAATALSLSRSAIVGVAVGLIVFVITDRRRVPIVVGGGLIAILGATAVIQSNPARFQNALLYKERVADVNVATRLDAWHAAAKLAGEHPVLGIGPGNFQLYFTEVTDRPPGTYNILVVHDAYLDIAAELGLVAAVLFVLYLGMIFVRLTAVARLGGAPGGYAQALRISLVIAAACSVFISEQYFLPFWLVGGLATALWRQARDEPRALEASASPPMLAGSSPGQADYDGPMDATSVDDRERQLRDEFAASRLQRQQLRALELEVAERQRLLETRAAEVADALTRHSGQEAALQRRERDLAKREAVLLSDSELLTERARELDRRAAELERERKKLRDQRQELTRRVRSVWRRERALERSLRRDAEQS